MMETAGTRKFVSLEAICHDLRDVSRKEAESVIDKLLSARVIEARIGGQGRTYSLSHETMVAKVRSWFDEREMRRRRAQETLQRGLLEWHSSGALLNKAQVESIRRWLPDALLIEARTLLQQSEDAIDAEEERALVQKRQMETARRRAKNALVGMWVAAVILVPLAALTSILAKKEENRAQRTQSLFLADLSRQITGSLQPTFTPSASTATLLALEALPDSLPARGGRPYVREAETSLVLAVSNLRERLIIEAHEGHAYDALFSPDGKRLLTRGWSSEAKLWSATGEWLGSLAPHEDTVQDFAFSPGGDMILTGSLQARLWSTATGDLIRRYDGHGRRINSVAFSPDSSTVATSSGNFARIFGLNGRLRVRAKITS